MVGSVWRVPAWSISRCFANLGVGYRIFPHQIGAWILDGSPTAMLSFYSWFLALSRETLSYLAMISQSVFSVWQTLFQLLAHQTRRIEAFHALWCSDPCRYNVPQLFINPCCIPARGTHRAKSAFFLMITESKPIYLVHFFLKVGIDTPLTMHIKIGPSSHGVVKSIAGAAGKRRRKGVSKRNSDVLPDFLHYFIAKERSCLGMGPVIWRPLSGLHLTVTWYVTINPIVGFLVG